MSRSNGGAPPLQRSSGSERMSLPSFAAPALQQLRPHPTSESVSSSSSSPPTSSAVASAPPRSASSSPRPPTSAVSDDVWARAIHAVKFQKMSLRQAAQLYGVHHMSLHRRIRGRYASTLPPSSDIRSFLSPDDEAEVLGVLREQFLHERRITSDDVRFVVRAIASQGGKQSIPAEFPPSRWIMEFKRAHGFTKLNSYAYPPPSDMMDDDDTGSNYSGYSSNVSSTATLHNQHQHQRLVSRDADSSMDTDDHQPNPRHSAQDEEFASNTSSTAYEAGLTTGSSSGGSYENGESEKRTYRLSHSVPAETWEKAIAAVEQQGMSLRAAAKLYGVHFAALHRRVKKRAQGKQGSGMDGYFQADDEAGIIRVVVARAELGVLMTFDELMDLVQRAALRNLPDLSVEAARKLMTRFQSRNEHSIRHIISDWPLPRANPLTAVPRVVNSPEQLLHARSALPHARGASPPPPPPPQPLRSYPSASSSASGRTAVSSSSAAAPLAIQAEVLQRGPLPSLRSAEYTPPPSSSIFSRHLFPSSSSSLSSSSAGGAVQRRLLEHRQEHFGSTHDAEGSGQDHHRDHHDSYDERQQQIDGRRGSGSSSDGDAVMFV